MCELDLFSISDAPLSVCQYLMARIIIASVFCGLALLYSVCAPNPELSCVYKMLIVGLGLEFCGLFLAIFYLGVMYLYVQEVVCTAIVCLCCCCVFPLVHRAQVRLRMPLEANSILLSTTVVVMACDEAFVMMCPPSSRVGPEVVAQAVPVVIENRTERIKGVVTQLAMAARAGVNAV